MLVRGTRYLKVIIRFRSKLVQPFFAYERFARSAFPEYRQALPIRTATRFLLLIAISYCVFRFTYLENVTGDRTPSSRRLQSCEESVRLDALWRGPTVRGRATPCTEQCSTLVTVSEREKRTRLSSTSAHIREGHPRSPRKLQGISFLLFLAEINLVSLTNVRAVMVRLSERTL